MPGVGNFSRLKKPAKALISITPAAKKRIRELINSRPNISSAIRISLKAGGCNGYTYVMKLTEDILPSDEIVKDEDLTLAIDPKATFAIVGTEMDYVESKLKSEFTFNNPNAQQTCGCGESFSTELMKKESLLQKIKKQMEMKKNESSQTTTNVPSHGNEPE